jgi:hypothetical protein
MLICKQVPWGYKIRGTDVLTNIHNQPTEKNICGKHGTAEKPGSESITTMCYANKRDRMVNSYAMTHQKQKWTKYSSSTCSF